MTDITFEECTKQLLKELKIDENNLKYEELRFLSGTIFDDYTIKKALQIDGTFDIDMHIPIRKVKMMLQEFQILIKENRVFKEKKNKKIVLVFLLMKHILYECYDMLNLVERPVDSLVFQYQGNTYTMAQLIYQRKLNIEDEKNGFSVEVLRDIFKDKQNRNVYGVLAFLGYHFDGRKRGRNVAQDRDIGNRKWSISLEEVVDIKKRDENEKIDRLLWNLLANGKSEFTNMEHLVKKLDNEVLLKSVEEQDKAWIQFTNDFFYNENLWKDNHTIFTFGINSFLKIFQAFRVANTSAEQWIRLLEFYFKRSDESNENKNRYLMIELLNYCDLTKNSVYLWVIKKIPTIVVAGNMNREKCYHKFLEEYLRAMEYWQYTEEYESWKLDFSGKIADHKDLVISVLEDIIKKMENNNEKCRIVKIKQERTDVITFLKWNLELIEKDTALEYPEGGFRASSSTKVKHKDETCYDALKKKKESLNPEDNKEWEKFIAEIDEAYRESKLYVREAEQLSEREC